MSPLPRSACCWSPSKMHYYLAPHAVVWWIGTRMEDSNSPSKLVHTKSLTASRWRDEACNEWTALFISLSSRSSWKNALNTSFCPWLRLLSCFFLIMSLSGWSWNLSRNAVQRFGSVSRQHVSKLSFQTTKIFFIQVLSWWIKKRICLWRSLLNNVRFNKAWAG